MVSFDKHAPVQVFIPLTRLCRDHCGYCTFAQPPVAGRRSYMTMQEMLEVAAMGAAQGCTEALFTLGEAATTPKCLCDSHAMAILNLFVSTGVQLDTPVKNLCSRLDCCHNRVLVLPRYRVQV